jgi:hypothetical protein
MTTYPTTPAVLAWAPYYSLECIRQAFPFDYHYLVAQCDLESLGNPNAVNNNGNPDSDPSTWGYSLGQITPSYNYQAAGMSNWTDYKNALVNQPLYAISEQVRIMKQNCSTTAGIVQALYLYNKGNLNITVGSSNYADDVISVRLPSYLTALPS